jgi:two-component system, NarL family, response regulator NreC
MTVRIVIADDHTVVRTGIKTELANQPDFEVIGEAVNSDDALQMANTLMPDVLLMDIQMPGMDTKDVVRSIKRCDDQVKVLILSAFKEQPIVIGIMKAGADGYILKDEDIFSIPSAIRKLMSGQRCISPTIVDILVEEVREPLHEMSPSLLTEKEIEVVKLITQGKLNKDVARTMQVSISTVEKHITHIYEKLDVSSRAELIRWAVMHGIV